MSLQSKYATVVATELRHHAVWEPGEPIRLGDYGILQHGRFSVQGNVKDEFGLDFEVIRSRKREYAFRSDGVSESRGDTKATKPGVSTEIRIGFRRADALYVSSPSAWTEHIKGLGRLLTPLQKDPQWRSEWVVVTRLYMASPAIILLSNADNADVKLHLGADGVAVAGDASNESGEQGSVALQLTGVHGALFMGLHRVTHNEVDDVLPARRFLSRVMVLAAAGLVGGGALAAWLVLGVMHGENHGVQDVPIATAQSERNIHSVPKVPATKDDPTSGELGLTAGAEPDPTEAGDPQHPTHSGVSKNPHAKATTTSVESEDIPDPRTSLGLGLDSIGGGGGTGSRETADTDLEDEPTGSDPGTGATVVASMTSPPEVASMTGPPEVASMTGPPVSATTKPSAADDSGSMIVILWGIVAGLAVLSSLALVIAVSRRRQIVPVVAVEAAVVDEPTQV